MPPLSKKAKNYAKAYTNNRAMNDTSGSFNRLETFQKAADKVTQEENQEEKKERSKRKAKLSTMWKEIMGKK